MTISQQGLIDTEVSVSAELGAGFPTGWFEICPSDAVPPGTARGYRRHGKKLLVWRDDMGAVHVMEPYCPHLGADISEGGTVEGDCVRCPAHGWAFGADGRNIAMSPAPCGKAHPTAALAVVPVLESRLGVLAWHDPLKRPPLWMPLEIPELIGGNAIGPVTFIFEGNVTCNRVAENYIDAAHFPIVHQNPVLPSMTASYDCHRAALTAELAGRSPECTARGVMTTDFEGPGMLIIRWTDAQVLLVNNIIPVSDSHTEIVLRFYHLGRGSTEKRKHLLQEFAERGRQGMLQDLAIWNHMRERELDEPGESDQVDEFRMWYHGFFPQLASSRDTNFANEVDYD